MNPLIRLLDDERLPAPSRILSLGDGASPLALALRERGHEVLELRPDEGEAALSAMATSSPGTFDAVLALGFVERLRWDRWALQQIHRVLKGDGLLILVVPDLYSPLSLVNPRYLGTRIAKLMPRVLGPLGRRVVVQPAREVERSYDARRLGAQLQDLGFDVRGRFGVGGVAPRSARAVAWVHTHHAVFARKRPIDDTAGPRAWFPDAEAHRRRFDVEHRAWLAARDHWRRRAGHAMAPRPLDTAGLTGARVLVLAPHPDDEIIGCGGTLLKLVRAGAEITILQATDGSASAALELAPDALRRTVRLNEARAVAEAAGFQPPLCWAEPNENFRVRPELVTRLRDTLEHLRPAWVFTPFLADIHPDHLTLNRLFAAALEQLPGAAPTVLGYEVWSLVPANTWCDVTTCMEDLTRLLLLYETAMKVDDFVWMCRARNHYHALTLAGSSGYVEAFCASDREQFLGMVNEAATAADTT